jgi:polyisoprenyl-teichoic acid--peptidoglycan teichoic acid transferase
MNNRQLVHIGIFLLGIFLLLGSSQVGQAAPMTTATPSRQPTNLPPPTNTKRPTLTLTPTPSNTFTATFTPSLTPTLTPSNTPTATFTPSLTPSLTPSNTPTATFTPSPTPTLTPTPEPTLVILGTYETPIAPPVTAIPLIMPTPVGSSDDVKLILLLGSDTITEGAVARTDVIIVVAVNKTRGTVSMLHFPRDLFVYAPNDTMRKINTVMNEGNKRFGPGGGIAMLKEAILYNFGLRIDHYARVDFIKFQAIIGQLGGLRLSVDCAVEGNRLKSPDLDITVAENYEVYTLNIGVHTLDPYMALWYVRARGSSSDLDRGRRQLEVLRAIWRQARNAGLIAQTTVLLPELLNILETDMTATDILGFAPLAAVLDPANIQRISLAQNTHFTEWYTPDVGQFAWLMNREAMQAAVQNFILPPPVNRLGGENPSVEIGAVLALKGYDETAGDRLAWEGFSVRQVGDFGAVNRTETVIYDYTGGAKPSSLETLRKTLRVPAANVIDQPNPNASADFRVEMGRDYGTSCFYGLPKE